MQRRTLAERPRPTVRGIVAALGSTREALVGLESQLGDILVRLRTPGAVLDKGVGERLASAKHNAVAAMSGVRVGGRSSQ